VNSLNRTPPKRVREKLRREVNFGCPVPGCGIPYLTWHHFDPPWKEKEHHNPEGMIALCAKDAALADGGRWTKQQLRQMKRSPYISSDTISENYGYFRKNVVCIIGNVAYDVKNILEIHGERVIGFERDNEGYNRLNLLIRDASGKPILVMEDNIWIAYSKRLFDLRCSTQGKELEIVSKDGRTNFSMRFDDYALDRFRSALLQRYQRSLKQIVGVTDKHFCKSEVNKFIASIGYDDVVPTWTIRGRLLWGDVCLEICDYLIKDLVTHNVFGMNLVVGGDAAFSFDNGFGLGMSTE